MCQGLHSQRTLMRPSPDPFCERVMSFIVMQNPEREREKESATHKWQDLYEVYILIKISVSPALSLCLIACLFVSLRRARSSTHAFTLAHSFFHSSRCNSSRLLQQGAVWHPHGSLALAHWLPEMPVSVPVCVFLRERRWAEGSKRPLQPRCLGKIFHTLHLYFFPGKQWAATLKAGWQEMYFLLSCKCWRAERVQRVCNQWWQNNIRRSVACYGTPFHVKGIF